MTPTDARVSPFLTTGVTLERPRPPTHLFVVLLLAPTRLNQDVKLALCLEHFPIRFPSFPLMTPDEVVRLFVEKLESREDLAQVGFGLGVHLLDGFVRGQGEDGDVHGLSGKKRERERDAFEDRLDC